MIKLNPNEKITKTFQVHSSSHGKGILYVTNLGIAFESQKYGLVLDVSFEWLQSYSKINNKFHIVWDTPQSQRFSYLFDLDFADQAVSHLLSQNQNIPPDL